MKTLHYTNCFFYLITIIPYATYYLIILGLYAQILLGIAQLIIAVILLFSLKKLTNKLRIMLTYYWVMSLTVLILLFANNYLKWNTFDNFDIIFMFIIPLAIATYFLYLTFLIKKHFSYENK